MSRPIANENRDANNNEPQRTGQTRVPQREERAQPIAQPRAERPQQTPQRMERPQQQERVEQPQPTQSQQRGGVNTEQGRARGESSGRPTRG